MKLLRYGPKGRERPAVLLDAGTAIDVSEIVDDYDRAFFAGGGMGGLRAALKARDDLPTVSLDGERIGAPIARPGAIACIGLNYKDHAAESGAPLPEEPVVFLKATNTVVGPYDDVWIPRRSEKTDWEVELAAVIGAEARYLSDEAAAAEVVAGYAVSNDLSEREFQLERGGQWDKGKSCETFNPLGPWLVTPDEIEDVDDLTLWCDVNGERMQKGNTGSMAFSPTYLVWYLSQFMVLEPGDVVNTGTPAGVGLGQDPPRYLGPGDVVTLGIGGLGEQRLNCRPAP